MNTFSPTLPCVLSFSDLTDEGYSRLSAGPNRKKLAHRECTLTRRRVAA